MVEAAPKTQARPQIKLMFEIGDLGDTDFGGLFSRFEFKAMINGGYIVRCTLFDTHFNLLSKLIKNGYLEKSRSQILPIRFQMRASADGAEFPETATRMQRAIVLSLAATGGSPDMGRLEFIAIDPPSWYLNAGDSSGGVYQGKVSQVIKQVVNEYAPKIKLDISETIDNEQNKFWMMRQDPKTFIASLVDWSASVTRNKTHWLIAMDGNKLTIKEQSELMSKPRAFYRYWKGTGMDTLRSWEFLADNALSIVQTKLLTQGLSAISGQYLDRITDEKEQKIFVKDTTTQAKKVAKTSEKESFTKPDDEAGAGPPHNGWSTVQGIPEVYSAGDIGLPYEQYLDGRPRGMWLNLINSVMRMKIKVLGHGEWSDCTGLGCDTIYLKWLTAGEGEDKKYFLNGNWIVYGFHHIATRGEWYTDLYIARYDYDSTSKKVGGDPSAN
jgi:hypothetical protein